MYIFGFLEYFYHKIINKLDSNDVYIDRSVHNFTYFINE
jgi:hypothetical protein